MWWTSPKCENDGFSWIDYQAPEYGVDNWEYDITEPVSIYVDSLTTLEIWKEDIEEKNHLWDEIKVYIWSIEKLDAIIINASYSESDYMSASGTTFMNLHYKGESYIFSIEVLWNTLYLSDKSNKIDEVNHSRLYSALKFILKKNRDFYF